MIQANTTPPPPPQSHFHFQVAMIVHDCGLGGSAVLDSVVLVAAEGTELRFPDKISLEGSADGINWVPICEHRQVCSMRTPLYVYGAHHHFRRSSKENLPCAQYCHFLNLQLRIDTTGSNSGV